MEGYEPSTYGDKIAGIYDVLYQDLFDVEGTVDLLAELAQGGPALELAIGTGRIALPLRDRGIDVHGVDISEAMVEKLRAKPGGSDIPVTMGDFAEVPVYGEYPLVYLIFNTR
jgi:ubiquinone/menaquinone biosynthesis C-methylase UbiE